MTVIKVCLGSSCYVRGNDKMLAFIENYIRQNNKEAQIELLGCRCTNACENGPTIFINDKKYTHLSQEELLKILETL